MIRNQTEVEKQIEARLAGGRDPLKDSHYLEIQRFKAEHGGVPGILYDADRTLRGPASGVIVNKAR